MWPSPKEAAIARDRLRLHHGRDRNLKYPDEARRAGGPASAEELRAEALELSRADRATVFRGVYWDEDRQLWRADAYRADRSGYDIIGFFREDVEAAKIRDRVMLHIHGPSREAVRMMLNFPNDPHLKPLSLQAARKAAGYKDRTNKSSPYLGVCLYKARFPVGITVRRERFHLGTFDAEVDAARAYDRAALFLRGPDTKLNFPLKRPQKTITRPASPEEIRRESVAERKRTTTSRYLGVSWSEPAQAWAVHFSHRTGHIFIGHFSDEEEAALAYDAVARELMSVGGAFAESSEASMRARLNFPDRIIAPRSVDSVRAEIWERFKDRCTSIYTGVSWSKLESKWRAIICVDGVTHQLGAFDVEADAARAYDRAALSLLGPGAHVNFPVKSMRSAPTPRSARRRLSS